MNRRDFVTSLLLLSSVSGGQACKNLTLDINPSKTSEGSLEPYSGEWTETLASYLLRRTTFGATHQQILQSVKTGLKSTIEHLFDELPLPNPPLNYFFTEDPNVPIGKTWVEAPYLKEVFFEQYRKKSIRAWMIEQLWGEGMSIREQLTLFWHNHFGVSDIIEHKQEYIHITLLRTYAWGNFKELVKKVTTDPAMLRFLNGRDNSAIAPNENYARELLELFTVGKGFPAAQDDYSTFTEKDVLEIARAMTGWEDRGFYTFDANEKIEAVFNEHAHDKGEKQLSHRFGNSKIPQMGKDEYAFVIDLIFEQEATALHICRKLYRWFVHHAIDDTIEEKIIVPLAEQLRRENFEIKPVLMRLLCSRHFFDRMKDAPKIKNPLEFIIGALRQLEVKMPDNFISRYHFCHYLYKLGALMQMELFKPPGVAGWKAYYQAPQFYRNWINASTLQYRTRYTDELTQQNGMKGMPEGWEKVKLNPLFLMNKLENPSDPNKLIAQLSGLLFVHPLTALQHSNLKEILLGGLPDDEWTKNCLAYLNQKSDWSETSSLLTKRLLSLISTMLKMPEFYLL
ncbi:MAG: DUF1800 domain-containing protein [Sphingobacteriales bacterium]|nr:MAG: DUF1800 domain-containing protein [Sphingobacteriales bacterium]